MVANTYFLTIYLYHSYDCHSADMNVFHRILAVALTLLKRLMYKILSVLHGLFIPIRTAVLAVV